MELVVDTNGVISALLKAAKSREIICSPKCKLYAPEQMVTEVLHHKEEIMEKAGIAESEWEELQPIVFSNMTMVSEKEFKHKKEQAEKLAKHPEDTPFLALFLAKDIPLWSNDKDMKQQSTVKVMSTEDLVKEW